MSSAAFFSTITTEAKKRAVAIPSARMDSVPSESLEWSKRYKTTTTTTTIATTQPTKDRTPALVVPEVKEIKMVGMLGMVGSKAYTKNVWKNAPIDLPTSSTSSTTSSTTTSIQPKTMIVIRGIPSSGKTTMAINKVKTMFDAHCKQANIVFEDEIAYDIAIHKFGVIYSADDCMYDSNGVFNFQPRKLQLAHDTCIENVKQALQSPNIQVIIVDNTHTQIWQMKSVVDAAIESGVCNVQFMEPTNHWSRKPQECMRKSREDGKNVPLQMIVKLLGNLKASGLVSIKRVQESTIPVML
jgi:hypothetical protein